MFMYVVRVRVHAGGAGGAGGAAGEQLLVSLPRNPQLIFETGLLEAWSLVIRLIWPAWTMPIFPCSDTTTQAEIQHG